MPIFLSFVYMEALQKWLKDKKPMKTGVALLKTHGYKRDWNTYLRTHSSDKKRVLVGLLSRILADMQKRLQKSQPKPKTPSVADKLRNEFPDIDYELLPDKLKLLVIKRYQLWETTKEQYAFQHIANSDGERFDASAAAIEAYAENREIWAELNYYQKFKKLRGKSRHFKKTAFEKELERLKALPAVEMGAEVAKKLSNLRDEIRKNEKAERPARLTAAIERYNTLAALIGEQEWEG